MNPDTAGRPVLIKGNTQLLFGGMGRLSENCVLNIKNKSHSVTAEIEVPGRGRRGRDHRPGRATSAAGASTPRTASSSTATTSRGVQPLLRRGRRTPLPAGEHQVRMEFAYAGGGLGKGGTGDALTSTARRSAKGTVAADLAMVFSADDGCDVGEDTGAPVSPDYGPQRQRVQRARQGRAARHRRGRGERRTTWSRRRTPSASRWRGSNRVVGSRKVFKSQRVKESKIVELFYSCTLMTFKLFNFFTLALCYSVPEVKVLKSERVKERKSSERA